MPDERGFTLIEVLISLVLLSVGVLAVLSVFASATRSFSAGYGAVEASARAAEVLESVRAAGCGGSWAGSGGDTALSATWRIDTEGSSLRRVTVVVGSAAVLSHADTFTALIPC